MRPNEAPKKMAMAALASLERVGELLAKLITDMRDMRKGIFFEWVRLVVGFEQGAERLRRGRLECFSVSIELVDFEHTR